MPISSNPRVGLATAAGVVFALLLSEISLRPWAGQLYRFDVQPLSGLLGYCHRGFEDYRLRPSGELQYALSLHIDHGFLAPLGHDSCPRGSVIIPTFRWVEIAAVAFAPISPISIY